MGAKISKRYSSYKSQPKASKLFLNFVLMVVTKLHFRSFDILKIEILTNFICLLHHGTPWEWKFENVTATNHSQKFSN